MFRVITLHHDGGHALSKKAHPLAQPNKGKTVIKLLLAIRSLDIGGAERQFIELVRGIDKNRFDVTVCTMYPGELDDEVKKIDGVKFVCLQKRGRYDLGFFWRYCRFLHKLQPDLIYSWLGEMNLFSLWCKPKLTKLIWSFRASNMDLSHYGRFSQLLFWLQKRGSFHVDRIVTNSWDSMEYHKTQGFDMDKSVVIPNGIDTTRFAPDPLARQEFRSHYALTDGEIAIGIVARYDPAKGYPILAQAAKMILSQYDRVHFFVVGYGDEKIRRECEEIVGDRERFIWLGKRGDVERIYPAFDIYLSSSLSESFSNTIAEAMACGVPCVVTDVGDSARIVGESGIVVEPGSVEALVRGIEIMMKSDRERLGQLARKRVIEHFSIARMVQRTQEVIEQCVEL